MSQNQLSNSVLQQMGQYTLSQGQYIGSGTCSVASTQTIDETIKSLQAQKEAIEKNLKLYNELHPLTRKLVTNVYTITTDELKRIDKEIKNFAFNSVLKESL